MWKNEFAGTVRVWVRVIFGSIQKGADPPLIEPQLPHCVAPLPIFWGNNVLYDTSIIPPLLHERMVVWNINFIFPYIGNNHPNWLSYFSEGFKPPTSLVSYPLVIEHSESGHLYLIHPLRTVFHSHKNHVGLPGCRLLNVPQTKLLTTTWRTIVAVV